MKIESLTIEQQEQLPVYREALRASGLRLQWASEDEIRSVVQKLYHGAGLEMPAVLVLDSPISCLAARQIIAKLKKSKGQLGGQLRDQLGGQLRDQLGAQPTATVRAFGGLR